MFPHLAQQVLKLQQRCDADRHRNLLWISGDAFYCYNAAETLSSNLAFDKTTQAVAAPPQLWVGSDAPEQWYTVEANQCTRLLGTEHSLVIFNAHDRFDCDAFAAICGTLVAGGLLVLLTPLPADWPEQDAKEKERVNVYGCTGEKSSRFIERFYRQLCENSVNLDSGNENIQTRRLAFSQNDLASINELFPVETLNARQTTDPDASFHKDNAAELNPSVLKSNVLDISTQHLQSHPEQLQLINKLEQEVIKHQKKVWVITADRGRGKSAALGILLGKLLSRPSTDGDGNKTEPCTTVVITAPAKRSVAILQKHYQLHSHNGALSFESPHHLLERPVTSQLLVIDEAAAIPLPILSGLLERYPKIILASTIQGYEGGGRGFAIRFEKLLQQQHITAQWLTLNKPIRWNENDPLERFCNNSLLLETQKLTAPIQPSSLSTAVFEHIPKEKLQQNEDLLASIFMLLINAHYQTKPMDLRHLLDGENLEVFVLRSNEQSGQQLLGAILAAWEGPIEDRQLGQAILDRKRRPRGHLLPQLIAQCTSAPQALELSMVRIVRIAIDPEIQNVGAGSRMLDGLVDYCRGQTDKQIDLLGAMYGSFQQLNQFWFKNGYSAFHTGFKKNKSSGFRSIAVIKAISPKGTEISQQALTHYQETGKKC